MSFDHRYDQRFEEVFTPAIESVNGNGSILKAHRVDVSQSGDSIITDILDGIAHCQLVLADVSCIGRDSVTGNGFRNGNVMYEVGLALACRHPSEVLLVRDDHDPFLFDTSTIPHASVDFSNSERAKNDVRKLLEARLQEQSYVRDARIEITAASMTKGELQILRHVSSLSAYRTHYCPNVTRITTTGCVTRCSQVCNVSRQTLVKAGFSRTASRSAPVALCRGCARCRALS